MIGNPKCVQCGHEMPGSHIHRKYCSPRCKGRWRKSHPNGTLADGHECRCCGVLIPLLPGQANKWVCSDACRRQLLAASVRNFHKLRPERQAEYRARTRSKQLPDSNVKRFFDWNPNAPRACQSCGERRVIEICHRPGHERVGRGRTRANSKWPEMVWVLCPTCHSLIDRMNYPPVELGLI